MPRMPRKCSESGYSHVTLRGNGKQLLFESDRDRFAFLDMLQKSFLKHGVQLVAWCLMGNHVHLIVFDSDGNLSKAVGALTVSYAAWYNHKLGHVGHVFQERFGSSPIENDAYLLQAIRYVHNNPCKAGLVGDPAEYFWSSHRQYLGFDETVGLVDDQLIRDLFDSCRVYREFMASPGRAPYVPRLRAKVSDEDAFALACAIAESVAGCSPTDLKQCEKSLRDKALSQMRAERMTLNQIQRATSLGMWIIRSATYKN